MRTGAAAGHTGYFHEAALYASDRELVDIAVPFLRDGVAAGEPVLVAFGEEHAALIRRATGGDPGITYLPGGDMYARPPGAIQAYRRMLADFVLGGAGQIRIIGELAPSAFGATWDWWARYESAINQAYDEFPLWSMCAYDTTSTPPDMLADVVRTHPRAARPDGGHTPHIDYVNPAEFLTESRRPPDDPLLLTAPVVSLIDPEPAEARQAVQAAVPPEFPQSDVDALVLSVSEAVTNASLYGRAPVRVRLWAGAKRLVLTVTDQGLGPKEPLAGMLPLGAGDGGGLGLWLCHQMCSHVGLYREDGAYTLRLTVGDPDTV
ncbi:sensor histidine kinase [Hamadaea tsunoensis]|uniref:sensor histidine kinase n=1 Tax=Hamadaea tsunoensis TaxID=53368 RepID=UPI00042073F7|nr:sensor histidine kinase [Hamadaea tsunoensis]